MTPEHASPENQALVETANDRFKNSFGNWFWGSMIAATVLHFALFALFPQLTAEDFSYTPNEMENIDLPPEIEIPPPPEQIARPATPVVTEADIDEDITIAPTTFEENPVENLPPPPEEGEGDISDQPVFVPHDTPPQMTNRSEVQRVLEREYPPLLRDAGIGGTVDVWCFVDENGRVTETRVQSSSGHEAFDRAAENVAEVMRFTPAQNRDQVVAVWISMPIVFEVR